jgi:site-specific DNA-methyltransferase (adenine-specific)
LASTPPGASILAPFAGSSTTGIAAVLIGDRQFTGIEREQKYIDLSIKRHRDVLAASATAWSVAVPLAA